MGLVRVRVGAVLAVLLSLLLGIGATLLGAVPAAAVRTTPTNFNLAATCTTFDNTSGIVRDVIVGDTITITSWGTCNRTNPMFWDSSWFTWSGTTTGGQALPSAPAVLTVTSTSPGATSETRVDDGNNGHALVIGIVGLLILPDVPTINAVTPGNGSVSVDFTAGADNGTPILSYRYQIDGNGWAIINSTTSPLVISQLSDGSNQPLVNGNTYTISIKAANVYGTGANTTAQSFTPNPTAPLAPTLNSATTVHQSTDVDFTVTDDGGSAVTNMEYSTDNGSTWHTPNPAVTTSPITVPGLTNGVAYNIKLRAVNVVGVGAESSAISVTPDGLPAAPSISSGTPANGSAQLFFTPGTDRGVPITNYEYELNGSGTWVALNPADASSPVTITGLTNGTAYAIKLRAVNAVGSGSASASQSVTPAGVPSAPTNLVATISNQRISIAYTAAAGNGSNVYAHEYSTDGGVNWTSMCPPGGMPPVQCSNPLVVTKQSNPPFATLSNGTQYTVLVRGVNAIGAGSSESVTATPAVKPDVPTNLVVTPGNATLSIAFTAGSDGGSPVTAYEWTTDGNNWYPSDPPTTTGPVVITGLTNGTTYTVGLRAVNAVGTTMPSQAVSGTPAAQVPATPTSVVGSGGNASATMTFNLGDDGGEPVSNIEYSLDGGSNWVTPNPAVTMSPLTITGLTNGQTYNVSIRPLNTVGSAIATTPVSVMAGIQAPSQVTGVSAAADNESVLVQFTAPADNGAPISNYEYSLDGGSNWVTPNPAVTSSPFTITGLTNGQNYNLAVRAVNSVGSGTASTPLSVTPTAQLPSTPTGVNALGGNGVVTVTFAAGADNGSPISNYEYSLDGGSSWVTPNPAVSTSPLTITGLLNGTTYSVAIRPVNGVGTGTPSSPTSVMPSAQVPATATGVTVTPGNGQVTVGFTMGTDGGSPVTNVEYSLDGGSNWVSPSPAITSSPFTITGLLNGTTYHVAIRPVNSVGAAAQSAIVQTTPTAVGVSIAITGHRTMRLVTVSGTSTGIAAGTRLTIRVDIGMRGTFGLGVARVRVLADGSFTWKRHVRGGAPIRVRFDLGSSHSNAVTLR